jgi:hypothetical protein
LLEAGCAKREGFLNTTTEPVERMRRAKIFFSLLATHPPAHPAHTETPAPLGPIFYSDFAQSTARPQALEVPSYAVADVQHLIERNLLVLRIDIARRSFIGQRGRAYLADQGIRGFARTLRSLLGIENPALAARYRALEQLPRGTLGREYFESVRSNGFALPGEKDGAPEVIVFHDCLHVLAGYSTVSLEETQIAAFQAGILRKDPLYGLLFITCPSDAAGRRLERRRNAHCHVPGIGISSTISMKPSGVKK